MRLMQFQIDDIIKTALLEDINYIDVTTDYLVDENSVSTAKYVSKDEGGRIEFTGLLRKV